MYTKNIMKLWPPKKYITARAIIIQDDKLLVFHRKRFDRFGKWMEYYSIPGGEIDEGETPEVAVIRELQEEMGVLVRPLGMVAHSKGAIFEHYVFAAEITKGSPHMMTDSEEMERASVKNSYEVKWIGVKELSPKNLKFYGIFYEHIIALSKNVPVEDVANIRVPKRVY